MSLENVGWARRNRFKPTVVHAKANGLFIENATASGSIGLAVTNRQTVTQADDDYILTEPCTRHFDFKAVTVTDLASLANTAYSLGQAVAEAAKPKVPDDV